jgi:hypothetical protein
LRTARQLFPSRLVGRSGSSARNRNDLKGCAIPELDPWDPAILYWVSNVPAVSPVNSLLYTDMDKLYLNTTYMKELNVTRANLQCNFTYVGTDDPWQTLTTDEVTLRPQAYEDAIHTQCVDTSTDKKRFLHKMLLFYVRPAKQREKTAGRRQYSVALIVIDSMSQMNFIRSLPRTLALLETMGGVLFRGHHKIKHNSAPNMMGLLSGELEGLECNIGYPCNVSHIVTNMYADRGYETLFMEDMRHYGGSMQFPNAPSPYSPTKEWPYRSNYNGAYNHLASSGSHTSPWNVFRDFIISRKEIPTFLHSHLSEYSHDDINMAKNYDGQIVDMLNSINLAGALNDTFLVLMGDHGYRFGSFPNTEQGTIENNMPGLVIVPPAGLQEEAGGAEGLTNLKQNAEVLTSHWDIGQMLRHVLALSTGEPETELFQGQESNGVSGNGISLLRSIPARSCTEAGVAISYCSCPAGQADLDPACVEGLVRAVLGDIDTFLQPLWGCLRLQDHVANISKVSATTEDTTEMIKSLVTMTIRPVEFRLKISYSLTNLSEVSGRLVRVDRYSDTSHCVPKREWQARVLCVCPPTQHNQTASA